MIEPTNVFPAAAGPFAAGLFSDLFVQAPPLVRGFLYSALRLGDLRQLLSQARSDSGGYSLSQAVLNLLNVTIHVSTKDMEQIASSGPLVIVANHPFGMLDGLLLDSLVSSVRPDLKIFTTALLCGIEEFQDRFLSLDVLSGKSATLPNARSLRAGIEWLRGGHVLAIFPAGEVSHWGTEALRIVDSPWSVLPVRCAARTNAAVLPVYFGGRNSLAFQLAGLVHPSLRTMRLPGELLNKSGRVVDVRVGSPIPSKELAERGSPETAASYLWARTYALGHRESLPAPRRRPLPFFNARRAEPMGEAAGGTGAEIARLEADGCRIVETGRYSVYSERGDRIPVLLREVGRLREVTFRAVGEGTGRAFDLDNYDAYYRHLILWNKEDSRIAGSYRLAWTEDVFADHGARGLYTSTLFRFSPEFFRRLGPAVELGRSFVSPEYQREHTPLLLLWQAIGRCVCQRPGAPVLFGAVSISSACCDAAREMIVEFLQHRRARNDLSALVKPRRPFRPRMLRTSELQLLAKSFEDIEDLSGPIRDVESSMGIPVLLRHYLKLGGRVAAFNIDRKFSNALDALLVVDLRDTPPRFLAKYMGQNSPSNSRCISPRPINIHFSPLRNAGVTIPG